MITTSSPDALACAAADWVSVQLAADPRAVLALPTGHTPLGLYKEMAARTQARRMNLTAIRVFNLDEYCGLQRSDAHSYGAFFDRHVALPLNLRTDQVRLLDGAARDVTAECRAYDEAIAACGGIDLCVLGLGVNGHIAFNEPGAAWTLRTHCTTLSAATREVHAGQAPEPWPIPERGLTVGIRTLLEARHILLLIAGSGKAAARAAVHRAVPDSAWPVTSLLAHTGLTAIELS